MREVERIRDTLWPAIRTKLNEQQKKPRTDPGENIYAALILTVQAHGEGCESVLGLLQRAESRSLACHPGMQCPASRGDGGPPGMENSVPQGKGEHQQLCCPSTLKGQELSGRRVPQRQTCWPSFQTPAKPGPAFATRNHVARAASTAGTALSLKEMRTPVAGHLTSGRQSPLD